MPRGDGTGPTGQGPRTGRGMRGGGRGQGGGMGRMGGKSLGPSGVCTCPSCGAQTPHRTGIPCFLTECPRCGTKMTRLANRRT